MCVDMEKAPRGKAIPDAVQMKNFRNDYSRNRRKKEVDLLKKYGYLVLLLLAINGMGFWLGYLPAVMML